MRIETLRAHGFGPFTDEELTFGPGLTIVAGANETGKSSWHAAASVALSGRRKGRARKTDVDISRYEPWKGGDWSVSSVLTMDDGRRVRLVHQLSAGRSAAFDETTGKEITDTLMQDGGVDASTLVGLTRLTLPLVSSVRQADILALSAARAADPKVQALRNLLQQVVSSRADADSSAEEALQRLSGFASTSIGTERRGSGKPLRQALDARDHAHRAYEEAVVAWDNHSEAEGSLAAATQRAVALRGRLQELAGDELGEKLTAAHERFSRAVALSAAVADEPDAGAPADEIQAVQDAVAAIASAPALPNAPERSSAVVQAHMDQLPPAPQGDVIPDQSIERLSSRLDDDARRQADLALSAVAAPEERTHTWSSAELRDAAASLQAAPQVPEEVTTPPVGLMAGGLGVGLLGLLVGLIMSSIPVLAIAMVVLVGVLAAWVRFRPASEPAALLAARDARNKLLAELGTAKLPADPGQLRSEATEVDNVVMAQRDRERWLHRCSQVEDKLQLVRSELAALLNVLGLAVDATSTASVRLGLDAYRTGCAARAEQAAQHGARVGLETELQRARAMEERMVQVLTLREQAVDKANSVGAQVGVDVRPGSDGSVDTSGLKAWVADQHTLAQAAAKAQRTRARLEGLLQGSSVDDLRRQRAQLAKQCADAGIDPNPILAIDISAMAAPSGTTRGIGADARSPRRAGDRMARTRQLRHDLDAAEQKVNHLAGVIEQTERALPSITETHEDVLRCDAEYARLCRLQGLVQATMDTLTAARKEVHQDIAPLIAEASNDRLARISAGRYKRIRVDPEDLSILVEHSDGSLVPAESLSHGTAEQIYLLARIAIAETLASAESCPLLLDDITVHADPDRTEAVLDLLAELSEDRQIVLFSQEDAVRNWAVRSDVPLVELNPV